MSYIVMSATGTLKRLVHIYTSIPSPIFITTSPLSTSKFGLMAVLATHPDLVPEYQGVDEDSASEPPETGHSQTLGRVMVTLPERPLSFDAG